MRAAAVSTPSLKVPLGQLVQTDAPAAPAYVPAAQSVQRSPSKGADGWYVPGGHDAHVASCRAVIGAAK
jgi:hypothetical protein